MGLKIAITGKGGVGKTTIAAIIIHRLSNKKRSVLAIDCDPNPNLKELLGIEEEIIPICNMKELIHSRMDVKESTSSFFRLNPRLEDIPERFMKRKDTISLMVMGMVQTGGGGCVCPESAFLKALLTKMIVQDVDDIVLDMEAGLEHLGRRTAEAMDSFLIVLEPSLRSISTSKRIEKLAMDIGIKKIYMVGNKIRTEDDVEFFKRYYPEANIAALFPFSEEILDREKQSGALIVKDKAVLESAESLLSKIDS